MNKSRVYILLAFVMLSIISCNRPAGEEEETITEVPAVVKADSIVHYSNTFFRGLDSCQAGDPACTYIRMHYPVLEDGPSPGTDSIRKKITELLQTVESEQLAPEAVADSFLSEYAAFRKRFKKENAELAAPWFIKKTIDVVYESRRFFCLSFTEESHTGGAHGNQSINYFNFDLATGKQLTLADIIEPEKTDSLTQIGEKMFRMTRNIPEGKKIISTGYFTFARHDSLVGKFYLNDNFSLGTNGLVFHYNPYEIAPYSNGASKIVIPYGRLTGLARPGSLLAEKLGIE